MRLLALAATVSLLATPALAQPLTLSFDQMSTVFRDAKVICPLAFRSPIPAAEVVDQQSHQRGYSIPENLLLLNLCLMYARGRNDG